MRELDSIFHSFSGYFLMWTTSERRLFEERTGITLTERVVSPSEVEFIGEGFTITFEITASGEDAYILFD
jgi:hypothetical protein